jgi:UDP-2,4-diacetamido-2,4,6-trideoxy-beta-L-altropyranose hydrolase
MKLNKVLIRVDGNRSIGLGHIYRGIALAEMICDYFTTFFVLNRQSDVKVFQEVNLDYIKLPKEIKTGEEPEWINKNYSEDTLIVLDGYHFDENYQRKIKEYGFKLVYIDDLVDRKMYADLVINYLPWVSEEDYEHESYTRFALGAEYVIMRKPFLKVSSQDREIHNVNRAFVCFGGSDQYDYTFKVVKLLIEIAQIKEIFVVLGASYNGKAIYSLQTQTPRIKIFRNLSGDDLLKIMIRCNLGIVPASGILNELIAVGMPIISGYYTPDQKLYADRLEKMNLIKNIGDFTNINKGIDFKNMTIEIINGNKEMVLKQKDYINGNSSYIILVLFKQL